MWQYKSILRKNVWAVSGTALLITLESLTMTFAGYSLSFLFTAYSYEGDRVRALVYTFFIVTAIWLTAMLVYYAALIAQAKLRQRIKNDLRGMIGSRIGSLSYAKFTGRDTGGYVSWLTNDVEQIYSQSFESLMSGIECLSTALFSFLMLGLLSPYICLTAVVLLAVISLLPQATNRSLQRASARLSSALETATESYKDAVMGGPIFFLANLRGRIRERISAASERAESECFRSAVTNTSVKILISTVSMVGQCVLLAVTLLAAVFGAAEASALLSVGNLAGSFFNGAGSFVQCFMTARASKPLWEKFQSTDAPQTAGSETLTDLPEIRLEDVTFGYNGRPVQEGLELTFRAGEKYAVMGESGSGKTSLAKLILGLMPEYTGRVMYGACEQRDTDLTSLYNAVAYVDQQVYLFRDTLRFNITLGESYTDGEIASAVRRCKLEDLVNTLPGGLDAVIMENGKNLSGGQRQRIALARGLIRRVRYVILDEGTSALDERNAADIENGLMDEASLGVILITHNLRPEVRGKVRGVYYCQPGQSAEGRGPENRPQT